MERFWHGFYNPLISIGAVLVCSPSSSVIHPVVELDIGVSPPDIILNVNGKIKFLNMFD